VNRESYFEALRIAGVDAQTIRNMENADNTAGNRFLENVGVNIESIATSLRQNPLYQSQLQMQQLFSNLPRNRAGSEGSVMSRFSRGGTLDETALQRLRDAAVPGLVKGLLGGKDPGDAIESVPGDDPDTTAQSIVGPPASGAGVEIGASPDGPIYALPLSDDEYKKMVAAARRRANAQLRREYMQLYQLNEKQVDFSNNGVF
jgi:hypothetical protein